MPETTVRAHPRKGTKGVRRHSRTIVDKTVPHQVDDVIRSKYLYHVTDISNVDSIEEEGLETYRESVETKEDMGYESLESFKKRFAREKLDELIPQRAGAVYFWNSPIKAEELRDELETYSNYQKQFRIVKIRPSWIEKDCYKGKWSLIEELYAFLDENAPELQRQENLTPQQIKDEKMPDLWKQADKMATNYKRSVTPFSLSDKPDPEYEIFCTTDVPPSTIEEITDYLEEDD